MGSLGVRASAALIAAAQRLSEVAIAVHPSTCPDQGSSHPAPTVGGVESVKCSRSFLVCIFLRMNEVFDICIACSQLLSGEHRCQQDMSVLVGTGSQIPGSPLVWGLALLAWQCTVLVPLPD